jgi:hypothetical protein
MSAPTEHEHHIVGPKNLLDDPRHLAGVHCDHDWCGFYQYGCFQPHRGARNRLLQGCAGHPFFHAHPLQLESDDVNGGCGLLHFSGIDHHDPLRLHQPQLGSLVDPKEKPQISPLRYAPVKKHSHEGSAKPQVPLLRFAPVGMTRKEGRLDRAWMPDRGVFNYLGWAAGP